LDFREWPRKEGLVNKHLRNYVRRQRDLKGIRLGPLAEAIGLKNRNKGSRLILQFEREGIVSDDLLAKLIRTLELNEDEIARAMEKDQEEWEAWVFEPVPMRMIVRLVAAVYCLRPIPDEITTPEEAVAYARNFAKNKHFRVCLALNRRESVWIGEDGEVRCRTFAKPGLPNIPYTTLGGRRKFLFGSAEQGFQPVVIREQD
jgi:hypothetical protein